MLNVTPVHPLHRAVLANGITVLVTENPTADIIAARLFIRAGSQWEQSQQAGLAHLLSAVLTKGTATRSSLEIAEQVESIGASLGTDSTTDYFLVSLKSVAADFPEILGLAAELLRSPSIPDQELELERRLTLQAIRSQQEQPFTVAFDLLRKMMYGEHPYALSGLGTEASVARLTRDDLFHFHHTHFRPDNLVISISGRITPDAAIALIEAVFGDWQAPPTPLPHLTLPAIATLPTANAIAQETQQAIVMLGYLAPAVVDQSSINSSGGAVEATASDTSPSVTPKNPDYAVLKLINTYLGNGLSSRLFVELREKRGLAYEVSAFYTTRLDTAQFVAYMGTAPDNTEIALNGLRSELERLCVTRLDEDELQAAKNKILGQYALGKQTNAQIAQTYGWYETLGLGIDFDQIFQAQIASTSTEQVLSVAQHYLMQPYVALVGPASAVAELAVSI